jgi:hypothetical protein
VSSIAETGLQAVELQAFSRYASTSQNVVTQSRIVPTAQMKSRAKRTSASETFQYVY